MKNYLPIIMLPLFFLACGKEKGGVLVGGPSSSPAPPATECLTLPNNVTYQSTCVSASTRWTQTIVKQTSSGSVGQMMCGGLEEDHYRSQQSFDDAVAVNSATETRTSSQDFTLTANCASGTVTVTNRIDGSTGREFYLWTRQP